MATTTASQSRDSRRRDSWLESRAPRRCFHARRSDRRSALIGQTAEEFVTKEVIPLIPELEVHKEGLMAALLKKAGETRPAWRRRAGGVRRLRPRQSLLHGPVGKDVAYASFA